MRKLLFSFMIFLLGFQGYSQTMYDSISDIRNKKVFSKWNYIILKDTSVGVIVINTPAQAGCGVRIFAALSIVKMGNDTIRVIDGCNMDYYKEGQKIRIIPKAGNPDFSKCEGLPVSGGPGILVKKKFLSKRYIELRVIDSGYPLFNRYDTIVKKTTYGHIVAQ